MKNKVEFPLWTQENPDICRFCAFANRATGIDDEIFCERKKKYFSEDNTCSKFKYDILKKELRRGRSQTVKYDPEQFEL